ncbi:MAG: hypothetical protein ACD_3C00033G0006 [uncultured bacterium (gcode 4)]|uniref:NurA domain-containing protein n=1 Tax=uncultured bacterium (gcode 4) TaxID=1234023 RepID=K2G0E5_9BACT|nr:MAG: hypothetical protein ACD_3C00033G0006 [uncultured bacterium (gcode 4)]
MWFDWEFASYEPLRRILDSEKVKALQWRFKIRKDGDDEEDIFSKLVHKSDLEEGSILPDWAVAIDGSNMSVKAENWYPGAEFGYISIASVLIDMKLVKELWQNDFIDPKKFRDTEKASTIESVMPWCNIIIDNDKSSKSSLRRIIYEELKNNSVFPDWERLLDTYEALLKIKLENDSIQKPKSPIDDIDKDMTYWYWEFICPYSWQPLFSTDALRLYELMNESSVNWELYWQIMSTFEKLWLIHILRSFEKKWLLSILRKIVFVMDWPLAVFSTSSWLTKSIIKEIQRINDLQKKINPENLMIIWIEKSGTFFNHFIEIDTSKGWISDKFPNQSALLLNDGYIKKNIIFSDSIKPYWEDTYFWRKFFYKTKSGQKLVCIIPFFNEFEMDLNTSDISQFSRLPDVMNILDKLSSSRYPNSVSPLISAHAEAAIPLNLGKKIFEEIAREIRTNSQW